jgi:hypothetical protein
MSLLNSRMFIIAVASAAMCGLLLIETTTHTAKLVYRVVVVADQLFRRPQKFGLQRMVGAYNLYHCNRLFSSLVCTPIARIPWAP